MAGHRSVEFLFMVSLVHKQNSAYKVTKTNFVIELQIKVYCWDLKVYSLILASSFDVISK